MVMDDFPMLPAPGQTFLFEYGIECRVHSNNGSEAEPLVTPYLDSTSKWSKKFGI